MLSLLLLELRLERNGSLMLRLLERSGLLGKYGIGRLRLLGKRGFEVRGLLDEDRLERGRLLLL